MVAQNRTAALQTLTSSTLMQGLGDARSTPLWQQYVDRYRPVILGYALRRGLSRRDAGELAETCLVRFSTAYRSGRYTQAEGRPSSWLFAIVRRQTVLWQRGPSSGLQPAAAGAAEDVELPPADEAEIGAWEAEWSDAILRQCLVEVRHEVLPESYRAFVGFAVRGRSAAEVAAELDTTDDAVYLAKRLVLNRLRDLRPVIEDLY